MVKDEEYIDFLKMIVACVSYGDYYSVKELSNLELEKMYNKMKLEKKKAKEDIGKYKNKLYTKEK